MEKHDVLYLICDSCIGKLRDSFSFRKQIEEVQLKLKKSLEGVVALQEGVFLHISLPKLFSSHHYILFAVFYIYFFDFKNSISILDSTRIKFWFVFFKGIYVKEEELLPSDCSWEAEVMEPRDDLKKLKLKSNSKHISNLKKLKMSKSKKRVKSESKKLKHNDTIFDKSKTSKITVPKYALNKSAVACEICIESFPSHKDLVSHMTTHFPNFVCDLCGKQFLLLNGLKNHLRSHVEDKITCEVCHKSLKINSMRRHVKTHNGEKDIYACPYCTNRFSTFGLRLQHLSDVHNITRRRYNCNLCPKTFSLSHHRSAHVRQEHLQERNHVCSECGKSFFSSSRLKEHTLSHTGEKNFKCDVCLKFFHRKFALSEHMKIHNNVKNHVCPICDKAFTQKCTLKGHLKTHNKEYSRLLKDCPDTHSQWWITTTLE